jgi:hypothetical protein
MADKARSIAIRKFLEVGWHHDPRTDGGIAPAEKDSEAAGSIGE